jgi:hypothetical protein
MMDITTNILLITLIIGIPHPSIISSTVPAIWALLSTIALKVFPFYACVQFTLLLASVFCGGVHHRLRFCSITSVTVCATVETEKSQGAKSGE